MVPLISFILFIKYTTTKNQKGKSYVFKDFTLGSGQIKHIQHKVKIRMTVHVQ